MNTPPRTPEQEAAFIEKITTLSFATGTHGGHWSGQVVVKKQPGQTFEQAMIKTAQHIVGQITGTDPAKVKIERPPNPAHN